LVVSVDTFATTLRMKWVADFIQMISRPHVKELFNPFQDQNGNQAHFSDTLLHWYDGCFGKLVAECWTRTELLRSVTYLLPTTFRFTTDDGSIVDGAHLHGPTELYSLISLLGWVTINHSRNKKERWRCHSRDDQPDSLMTMASNPFGQDWIGYSFTYMAPSYWTVCTSITGSWLTHVMWNESTAALLPWTISVAVQGIEKGIMVSRS
jgi:hypothetical protein